MFNPNSIRIMPRVVLLVFLVALVPVTALGQEDSGRVVFLRGTVEAMDSAGNSRQLQRDDRVYAAETVASGSDGLAQIIFPDHSMLYIKPESRIEIEQYRFDIDDPEQDGAVVNLLKGGMRALTGAIGKRNPKKISFRNRMGVIGIRGTAIELGENNVIFDFGQGSMENEAGTTLIGPGESARATSPQGKANLYLHERSPDDASVLAQVLVDVPLEKVADAAGLACRTIPEEEAILLMGMENQVPGYMPGVTPATVEGLTVCYEVDEFGTILTAATLFFPGEAPQMLAAALRGKGGVKVAAALKAILKGFEHPSQELVNEVVSIAVTEGNLDVESARQVLQEVQEEGFCR